MKRVFYILLIAALIGAGFAYYLFDKKVERLDKVKPDFIISANELYDAFLENENDAMLRFESKIVEVSGRVGSISQKDSFWNVTLKAQHADMSDGINCSFPNNPGELGDSVTIRGVCHGMLFDVVLNNCYLVQSHP